MSAKFIFIDKYVFGRKSTQIKILKSAPSSNFSFSKIVFIYIWNTGYNLISFQMKVKNYIIGSTSIYIFFFLSKWVSEYMKCKSHFSLVYFILYLFFYDYVDINFPNVICENLFYLFILTKQPVSILQ